MQSLNSSDMDAAIATSIIQLAHNRGLTVVAEGITEAAKVMLLAELEGDIEGLPLQPPMPPELMGHFIVPPAIWYS